MKFIPLSLYVNYERQVTNDYILLSWFFHILGFIIVVSLILSSLVKSDLVSCDLINLRHDLWCQLVQNLQRTNSLLNLLRLASSCDNTADIRVLQAPSNSKLALRDTKLIRNRLKPAGGLDVGYPLIVDSSKLPAHIVGHFVLRSAKAGVCWRRLAISDIVVLAREDAVLDGGVGCEAVAVARQEMLELTLDLIAEEHAVLRLLNNRRNQAEISRNGNL